MWPKTRLKAAPCCIYTHTHTHTHTHPIYGILVRIITKNNLVAKMSSVSHPLGNSRSLHFRYSG